MMKGTTNRVSLGIRIMLLMICCVLFMPPHGHAGESKETQSFRMASLTLAVSGISNPVSQLKTFAESDGTSLRSPGKRQQNASTGFDGGDAPAALPPTPEARWRGFCQTAGVDITSLPVERRLRRAVLRPERPESALTGRDLYDLGLRGGDIGAARQALERHILQYPEENQRKILQNKIKVWGFLPPDP